MRTYGYNLTLNQEGQVRHKQKSVSGCVGAIIVNLDASVKIQIASGPIQNINASISVDDWCDHSFFKTPIKSPCHNSSVERALDL